MRAHGPQLVVLPDSDRVEQHLLAHARARGVADGAYVWTLSRLEEVCARAAASGIRPASPMEARLVVAEVARALRPAELGPLVEQPSFARLALGIFEELEAGGVLPRRVLEAATALPGASAGKVAALATLWSAWRDRLKALRWAGRAQVIGGALQALRKHGLPPQLAGIGGITVREVYDFPPLRADFFVALAHACERDGVSFTLTVPGSGSPLVDAAVDPMLRKLEGLYETLVSGEANKALPDPQERPWSALGELLYQPEPPAGAAAHLAERTSIWSAPSPKAELEQLTREVLRQLESGVPPDRLAVAFRNLGEEAEALAARLADAGVAARVRVGAPLGETPLGRLGLELPLMVEEGFPVGRVVTLLEFTRDPERSPGAAAVTFSEAAIRDDRRGASGGKGAYEVRLSRLAARLERTGAQARARQVRALASRTAGLLKHCAAIPEEGTALELFQAWWRALSGLGLLEASASPIGGGEPSTALGRALMSARARDQAAAEGLKQLARSLSSGLRGTRMGQARMGRRQFARWLADASLDLRVRGGGAAPGAVQLLELRELVGRSFTWIGIGGLSEGRLPGRAAPHPLLDESERQWINAALGKQVFRLWSGEEQGLAPWRLAEDRLLFFQALAAAEEGVSLGHARADASGREQQASPFLQEISLLLASPIVQLPARVVPALEDALEPAALRERIALETLALPELRSEPRDPSWAWVAERTADAPWLAGAREVAQMEEARLHFFGDPQAPPGAHTGAVGEASVTGRILERFTFGAERPLSASALESIANCRFRGFLRVGLGLGEPESAGEDVDARGRGTLHHRVLELLFTRLREEGLLGTPPGGLPEGLVDAVLEQALEDVGERTHTGHPALWALARERAKKMVERVLGQKERGLPFEGLLPENTELVFGTEGAQGAWREVRIDSSSGAGPIHLTGKIDRLDAGGGRVGVLDYKSRTLTRREYAQRLLVQDFQMPLYLIAAREAGHPEAREGAWLSLRDGASVLFSEVLEAAGVDPELLLAVDASGRARARELEAPNVANAVEALVGEVRKGHFPIRSEDCSYCGFRAVCRITERRLRTEEAG